MPGGRRPGPSVKGGKKGARMYEHIRASGASKQVAAATVNKHYKAKKRGGR